MSNEVFRSRSWEDTFDFAREMAANARPGDIICLVGDLGSGKTVFAKGFAAGLGIESEVVSPTFTMLIEYPAGPGRKLPMYHFDCYRFGEARGDGSAAASAVSQFESIGGDDCLFGEGICLIEWAEMIRPVVPAGAVWVEISRCGGDDNEREIKITRGEIS